MDGEGMHAAGQLPGQRRINHTVTLESALSAKGLRHDIYPEMGLSAGPVPGMAGVLVRLVDHAQAFRIESFGQLSCDEVRERHGSGLWVSHARRSMLSGACPENVSLETVT
jgi:hypothetical protein